MTAERPILFSVPMVRAILEGRKTQTRRVIKPQPTHEPQPDSTPECGHWEWLWKGKLLYPMCCPYGQPPALGYGDSTGTHLWVREQWALGVKGDSIEEARAAHQDAMGSGGRPTIIYRSDKEIDAVGDPGALKCYRWRPPIHMPRWASRLTLEITGVQVQRVQEITEEDAQAEGFLETPADLESRQGIPWLSARQWFSGLWDDINSKPGHTWAENPWVWAISFHRVDDEETRQ